MNLIFNIDYRDLSQLLIKENVKPDLIVTDPPYDIPCIHGGGSVNRISKLNTSLEDLKQSGLMNSYDIKEFAKTLDTLQKGNINAYFWCNKKQIPDYLQVYVTELGCKFDIISWHKTNALPTYSNKYMSDTEYCLYFRKGKGHCFPSNYEDAKTFWLEPINHKDKKEYGHPTIKPLPFIEKIIRNSSKEKELVFDPFLGSGTTALACKNLNRDFMGGDLDAKWVELAKKRLETSNK